MGRKKKQIESDEPAGAPEWMVTFSDCMTLLLTFFVLLLSFSSFDKDDFDKLKVIFTKALPSVNPTAKRDRDAIVSKSQIQRLPVELDKGSEYPTLAPGMEAYEKQEKDHENFRERKVFLIPSKQVFYGQGIIISGEGKGTLSKMAEYLKKMPERIVITERTVVDSKKSAQLGLGRSWALIDFFTTNNNMDKNRFNISVQSTLAESNPHQNRLNSKTSPEERTVEIVLLERSIYN
ncbi:MAG: flagellar motor protein MotB [Planctomycetota bacterium]|jgi:chemotaxis protein MotB